MSPRAKKGSAPRSAASAPAQEEPATVDGSEQARLRRLARAGVDVDTCPLLGATLDVGPRANPWRVPRRWIDESVLSELALAILHSRVTPEDLEHAAKVLRERSQW